MRLTCPNCNAQYEVGDGVIPPGGRDVQCSACGTTWFQYPAEVALRMRAADLDDDDDDEGDGTPAPASPRPPEGGQRIDKTVLDVLRQEAARELEARRGAPAPGVETQPDLGLVGRPRPRGDADGARRPPPQPAPEARRSRLPDIETLSTTIETANATREADARAAEPESSLDPPPSAGQGFRRGLAYVLLACGVLVALYFFAEALGRLIPALAGPLSGYVALVEALRLSVAQMLGA